MSQNEAARTQAGIDFKAIQAEELKQLKATDRPNALFGLCLSGGGIRSATFNLGVLEVLEEKGLLNQLDYLSTVSGGGYIGSYVLANRKRKQGVGPDNESSLQHLRRFSNYLAPDASMFSLDTWTMIAIWLRNTTLLQGFLISLLAAVLLLPRLWAGAAWNWLLIRTPPSGFVAGLAVGALTLLCVAGGAAWIVLKPQPERPEGLWLAVGAALGSSTLLAGLLYQTAPEHVWWLAGACGLAILFGSLVLVRRARRFQSQPYPRPKDARIALAVLVAAAVAAGLVLLAQASLGDWVEQIRLLQRDSANLTCRQAPGFAPGPLHFLMWAVPGLLIALCVSLTCLIGFAGRAIPDLAREVFSRMAAGMFLSILALLLIGAMAMYSPLLTLQTVNALSGWIAAVGGVSGLGAGLAGLLAANGKDTGAGGRSMQEVLAALAPYLLIAVLLIGISFGLHTWLLHSTLSKYSIVTAISFRSSDISPFAAPAAVDVQRAIQLEPGAGLPGFGPAAQFYWSLLWISTNTPLAWILFVAAILLAVLLAWRIDINEFSMNPLYRNRLVRCFMGAANYGERGRTAPRLRKPHAITGFDPQDDFQMTELAAHLPQQNPDSTLRMPIPIVNTALNAVGAGDAVEAERRGHSMFFTPLHVYSDATGGAAMTEYSQCQGPDGLSLGTLVATSGAAANPNCGFHTSAPVAFLLTFFNVRLGRWVTNPKRGELSSWTRFSLVYSLFELFGSARTDSRLINLSDGGHFENLGLYELIRRRCRYIIVGDGEQDNDYVFEGLGTAIRRCRDDFNAEISIKVEPMQAAKPHGECPFHYSVGTVRYDPGLSDGPAEGFILYLKSSFTGEEAYDVQQYKRQHPDFPHETTGDQFFSESQFESYRKLGETAAREALPKSVALPDLETLFAALHDGI